MLKKTSASELDESTKDASHIENWAKRRQKHYYQHQDRDQPRDPIAEGIDNWILMHDSPFCGEPEPALPEQNKWHESPQDLGRPILLEGGGAVDKEGQN